MSRHTSYLVTPVVICWIATPLTIEMIGKLNCDKKFTYDRNEEIYPTYLDWNEQSSK